MPLYNNPHRRKKQHALGPEGQEVAASGIFFFTRMPDGRRRGLFQIEDMKLGKVWTPALSLFGGKLNSGEGILLAAIREFREETGASSDPAIRAHVEHLLRPLSDITPKSFYVPESKYLVYAEEVNEVDALEQLPRLYADAFGGKTSADLVDGDYTRAATRLVVMDLEDIAGLCDSLPVKVELQGFLREFRRKIHYTVDTVIQ